MSPIFTSHLQHPALRLTIGTGLLLIQLFSPVLAASPSAREAIPLDVMAPMPTVNGPLEKPNKLSRAARKPFAKPEKTDARASASPSDTSVIAEVLKLKWQTAPLYGAVDDLQKIGLEKVLKAAAERNLSVRQAEAQAKEAETQAKELVESNPLILLNPIQLGLMKQAESANVQAARAHVQVARQKALLESASRYYTLTQAYLAKYSAFQAIEQGKTQLKVEESRFINGETDRFGVTQTEMALIDRYSRYMSADHAYYSASVALCNFLDLPENNVLVPEEVSLQSEINMVPTLKLFPESLTLEKAQKMALTRPDIQEVTLRREALQKLIKASFGQEKRKREADLKQLDLQAEQGLDLVSAALSRAYAQVQTAKKNLQLAQQRYELAISLVRQLEISNKAGFSSTKEVLDGQLELARSNANLIEARLGSNLAQIQLAYELGLLQGELISRPLPMNLL
jgi:outer membrane protein TolC